MVAGQQNINISDISPPTVNNGGAMTLPIRSEKVFQKDSSGSNDPPASYHIEQRVLAALTKYDQYVTIRIKGRTSQLGEFNASSTASFQFLINPEQAAINRQTVDEQAQTRSGWQVGVWGEDFISITLNGKTPGRYFTAGLTSNYAPWTHSYRSLMALEILFENNGCWFEGEQVEGTLGPSTRRIKAHQDVELVIGEFIWYGMFESMSISEAADSPYLASFSLGFTAWREEFAKGSPYNMPPLGTEQQKGHILHNLPVPPAPPQGFIVTSMVLSDSGSDEPTTPAVEQGWWNSSNTGIFLPDAPAPPSGKQ